MTTGTGDAQRKRGAALEDAILEAAYAELSEVGYSAFSVEGVAARARTGKASIYRRWPTKQESSWTRCAPAAHAAAVRTRSWPGGR